MAVLAKNKKAKFEFEFLEKFIAGIQLVGSEVKSIKKSKVNIADAFCYFKDDELFIKGMNVEEYKQSGTHQQHVPNRDRKLLLTKKELKRLLTKTTIKGNTIVPVSVIQSDKGFIKIEIALARGKKLHDKRETIKKRDMDRDMKRNELK
jgi:SsrA-binding protein